MLVLGRIVRGLEVAVDLNMEIPDEFLRGKSCKNCDNQRYTPYHDGTLQRVCPGKGNIYDGCTQWLPYRKVELMSYTCVVCKKPTGCERGDNRGELQLCEKHYNKHKKKPYKEVLEKHM